MGFNRQNHTSPDRRRWRGGVLSRRRTGTHLTRPVVTSVIIGAKRRAQLADNLAAVDLELSHDEIKQLDDVSALPVEYPGWMVDWQSTGRLDPSAHKAIEDLTALGK